MEYLLWFLFEVAAILYDSDDRPKARAFSIGCLGVVLVAAVVVGVVWVVYGMGR